MMKQRLLLLISKKSYRAHDFLAAAERLGVPIAVGSDHHPTLAELNAAASFFLDFRDLETATAGILDFSRSYPLAAIVPLEEDGVLLAARASQALGLPYCSLQSVQPTRNKFTLRKILTAAELPQPAFRLITAHGGVPNFESLGVGFPCVIKPLFLSASRGVMRCNDIEEFRQNCSRLKKILADPEVAADGAELADKILLESFIPGIEVALEGVLEKGELHLLALFDKPDPLAGPFFEETLYITPSRLDALLQEKIRQITAQATRAIGLITGPIHAELRVNDGGIWLIELAARSIGGLCSRVLRFGTGMTLEEIILGQAMGRLELPQREERAAGVMMIPIPKAGVLREVQGKEKAREVAGIEEIDIMIPIGQTVTPLPEGSRYLGFIFARAETPQQVELVLREAHRQLHFVIT